jgi:DNA invertase Pin-like site-specific DNA recombinase
VTVLLIDKRPPKYQVVADRVQHLQELGLTTRAIAKHLGISSATVCAALAWVRDMDPRA